MRHLFSSSIKQVNWLRKSESQLSVRIEGQYSQQRLLTRELDDLRSMLDEQHRKSSFYDHEHAHISDISKQSRFKLDTLLTQSRQLGDSSLGLKFEVQSKEREQDTLQQEVEQLRKRKGELLHVITTATVRVQEGHESHTKLRQDIDKLKHLCQELRIDIEERKRQDAKEALRLVDVEGELAHAREKLEGQTETVQRLEGRYEEEKQFTQDLNVRLRHEKTHNEAVEQQMQELLSRNRDLELQLERLNDESVRMRRVKEANNVEKQHLESEVKSLNQLCEVRMKANENLARELQQLAEDDEIIRQRLDRANRIMSLKDRNGSQINESLKQLEKSKSPIRRREPYE
ncbi:hypothetical protein FGO68_gene598 [Halteria grandinella]|uniref:Uncharacterized protein n=1 Tax=Halteria grandinella TaxID=5974 RepID=A0A8J8NNJ3_HALGN|nr:hypothetical protein FGO68_gene598 [Halteria grandinella]